MAEHFDTLVAAGQIIVRREGRDEAITAIRNGATGEISPLLYAAVAHGMLPILCQALETHASDVMTDRSRELVTHERELAGARALAAIAQLGEALDALERAGIRAMPYKGPALSLDAYGDAALRSSDDIDVLVDPADVEAAWAALNAIGYRVKDGWTWRRWRAANAWQGQVPLYGTGGRLTLDLHWRTCDEKLPWNVPVAELLARGRTIELSGRKIVVPEPTDQLILVLLHAARHGWDRLEALVCAAALRERGIDDHTLYTRPIAFDGVWATNRGLNLAEIVLNLRRGASIHDPEASGGEPGRSADDMERLRKGDAGARRDAALHLGSLENLHSRARYVFLAAVLPTVADFEAVRLPTALEFLYPLVRLARLATR